MNQLLITKRIARWELAIGRQQFTQVQTECFCLLDAAVPALKIRGFQDDKVKKSNETQTKYLLSFYRNI